MTVSRDLSCYELMMTYRDIVGAYSNFVIAAQYTTKLDKSTLLPFLSKLCLDYPQMTLQIKNLKSVYPLETISYDQVVSEIPVDSSKTINEAVADICQTLTREQFEFGVELPLWRLVIYDQVLFVVCQHSILDGNAGKLFHDLYVKYLDSLPSVSSPDGQDGDPVFDLNSAMQKGFEIGLSPPELLKHMKHPEGWLPPKGFHNAFPSFNEDLLSDPIYYHRSTFYNISPSNVQKLLQNCRENSFKLTSLLWGFVSVGLNDSGILANGGDCITTLIPINSRIFIDDPKTDHAMHLLFSKYIPGTSISTIPQLDETGEFVKYCQNFHKNLIDNIPTSWYGFAHTEEMFEKNPELPQKAMEFLASKEKNLSPTNTIAMSNVGGYKSERILNAWFDQPMVDAAVAAHIISSTAGVNINFMSHRAVSNEDYQEYIKAVTSVIEDYLKSI